MMDENLDELLEEIIRETKEDAANAEREKETAQGAEEADAPIPPVEQPKKGPLIQSKKMYYALLGIFSAVFLLCVIYLGSYFIETGGAAQNYDILASIRDEATAGIQSTTPTTPQNPIDGTTDMTPTGPTEPVMLPELVPIYEINKDLVGWIKIPNLNLSYPVAQSKYEQNYYLYRDFYGEDSISGCLYADEDCDVQKPSDNVVIYGHAMKTEAMFGALYHYQEKSYWEQNQYFTFDSLYERHTYQIFAVFKTPGHQYDEDGSRLGYPYHHKISFADEAAFNQFISDVKGEAFISNNGTGGYRGYSFYDTGITPKFGDKLLCLSTCEYSYDNGRLAILAVQVE